MERESVATCQEHELDPRIEMFDWTSSIANDYIFLTIMNFITHESLTSVL